MLIEEVLAPALGLERQGPCVTASLAIPWDSVRYVDGTQCLWERRDDAPRVTPEAWPENLVFVEALCRASLDAR
ncbi:MAG: hypothetical protein EP330_26645 [Deltaproteobacteria bacterium]|nr:MAG: hypothetical protein EP330_26645 [Deltaproteobacteria bacterium]